MGNAWCGKWEHFSIRAWSWSRCTGRVADFSSAVSGFRGGIALGWVGQAGAAARSHEFVEETSTTVRQAAGARARVARAKKNVGCEPRSGCPSSEKSP